MAPLPIRFHFEMLMLGAEDGDSVPASAAGTTNARHSGRNTIECKWNLVLAPGIIIITVVVVVVAMLQ